MIANTWYEDCQLLLEWFSYEIRCDRAILHDEEVYHEPAKFDPERFLQNGNISFALQPDPNFSFGYGRRCVESSTSVYNYPHNIVLIRICPGRHLALNSAWLAVVSILATYDIGKAVDDHGNAVEPRVEFTDGLVRYDDEPMTVERCRLPSFKPP